jgi:hypothetical protein
MHARCLETRETRLRSWTMAMETELEMPAGAGACKVASCRHTDDLECQAQAIRVDRKAGGVARTTFEKP